MAYDHATDDRESYLIFRSLSIRIGIFLGLACFLVISLIGLPIWTVFMVAAIFALLPMLMKP